MYGNHLIDAPMHSPQFVRENLISVDWSKADLKKESQWDKKTHELRKDSIQYVFSQIIWNDYKVIIDDAEYILNYMMKELCRAEIDTIAMTEYDDDGYEVVSNGKLSEDVEGGKDYD